MIDRQSRGHGSAAVLRRGTDYQGEDHSAPAASRSRNRLEREASRPAAPARSQSDRGGHTVKNMSAIRKVAVSALFASLLVVSPLVPAPDAAAAPVTVTTFADVATAFADPDSVTGGPVTIGASITGGNLALAAGETLTLTLGSPGVDLTVARVTLGAGSTLRIDGGGGKLVASDGIRTFDATLDVFGSASIEARTPEPDAAAIGGGSGQDGGTIHLHGSATVVAGDLADGGLYHNGAGVGGGRNAASGTITIDENAVVNAVGPTLGAGIGGGGNSRAVGTASGGTITIGGNAVVTAHSGEAGAGIGSGDGSDAGTIVIEDNAVVSASSAVWGAGIGAGGAGGGRGTITIRGNPVVSATADSAAAIGAGGGVGADVQVLGGTVTADATPLAVGGAAGFGSLLIAAPGTLVIPAGATLTVPAGVTVTGDGSLVGAGTVVNDGAIQLPTANVEWQPANLDIGPSNYLVTFDPNYTGAPAGDEVRVFAGTFAAGARSIHPLRPQAGSPSGPGTSLPMVQGSPSPPRRY